MQNEPHVLIANNKIHVLVANDFPVVRTGIEQILKPHKLFSRITVAKGNDETIEFLLKQQHHVVVLSDVRLSASIIKKFKNVKTILVSPNKEWSITEAIVNDHAHGYMTLEAEADEFIRAIKRVLPEKNIFRKI